MARTGLFISHAHGDDELAKLLAELLRATLDLSADQVTCTSDEQYGLNYGSEVKTQITSRLARAQAVVLLATPSARSRDWVQYECAIADVKRAEGLAFYVAIPTEAHRDVVPEPYRSYVAVQLNRARDVHSFAQQIARDLAQDRQGRAESELAAVVDCAHELALREQAASVNAAIQKSAVARNHANRVALILGAVALLAVAASAFAGARSSGEIARLTLALETKEREMNDSLNARDGELSSAMRDATLETAEAFKAFSVSGLVLDRNYRQVQCASVTATLNDGRKVENECDATGAFRFLPSELSNDARSPVKLQIRVSNKVFAPPPVTLTNAELAVVLRQ